MAGQDIKKRLQPGQSQPVNVGGDFIFLKFADRPVNILINGGESAGSRVTMEPGDKYRPGPFDSFEVENSDTTRPAQIIMTVGRGDYNRQIVKGEIGVTPVLRKADGSTVDDTRSEECVTVSISGVDSRQYEAGEVIKEKIVPDDQRHFSRHMVMLSNRVESFRAEGNEVTSGELQSFVWSLDMQYQGTRTKKNFETPNGQFTYNFVGAPRKGIVYAYQSINYPLIGVYSEGKTLLRSFQIPEEFGKRAGSITVDYEGNLVFFGESEDNRANLVKFDEWGNWIATVKAGVQSGGTGLINIAPDRALLRAKSSLGGSTEWYWLNPITGELIEQASGLLASALPVNGNYCQFLENENVILGWETGGDNKLKKIVIEDFFSPGQVIIYQGAQSIEKTKTYTLKDGADLYQAESAKYVIHGPIIGEILKFLKGNIVKDYMDHVYKMEVAGQFKLSGNYSTLKRIGVTDSVKMELPAAVKIEMDEGVKND